MINELMKEKNMTMYRLSKSSGVPYSTINDICSGKASLEKCSAETVYHLASALDISMENLLEPYVTKRASFDNFKSTVCHRLKEIGDIDFIIDTLQNGEIRSYYVKRWYPESFYLLAMVDYLSRLNKLPLCEDFEDIRHCRLSKPVYPASLRAESIVSKDPSILKEAEKTAIPEFMHFNIVENEVRDVI